MKIAAFLQSYAFSDIRMPNGLNNRGFAAAAAAANGAAALPDAHRPAPVPRSTWPLWALTEIAIIAEVIGIGAFLILWLQKKGLRWSRPPFSAAG